MFASFSYISPAIQEEQLKTRIIELQAEMLDFNRKISPSRKTKCTKTRQKSAPTNKMSQSAVKAIYNFLTVTGYVSCVVWPFLFPASMYLAEGCSAFFWFTAIVCTFISAVVFVKIYSAAFPRISSFVRASIRQIIQRISHIINIITTTVLRTVRYVSTNSNTRFLAMVIVLVSLVSVLAHVNGFEDKYSLFAMLVSIGFLSGISASLIIKRDFKAGTLPLTDSYINANLREVGKDTKLGIHRRDYDPDFSSSQLIFRRSPPPTYQQAVLDAINDLEFSPASFHQQPLCSSGYFQ